MNSLGLDIFKLERQNVFLMRQASQRPFGALNRIDIFKISRFG
jgi:hypothetical protein